MAKTYKYCGNGLGVAGLPHEITDQQAQADGVGEHLKAAIVAGLYKEVRAEPAKAAQVENPQSGKKE